MEKTFDEKSLIQQAKKGDKQAFLEIYNQFFDKVFRFIYFKLGSQAEAEDIAQETFLKAMDAIKNFEGKSTLQTWLIQIAKFTLMDYFRREYRYPTTEIQDYLVSTPFDYKPKEEIVERAGQIVGRERTLKDILEKLPEKYRATLECRFLKNLSLKETAEALKTNVTNVKVWQHRGLKKASQISDGFAY